MRSSARERQQRMARTGLLALVLLTASCLGGAPASVASTRGLVVVPRPVSGALSYFKLQATPGTMTRAGTIELRNPTSRSLRVGLSAVDGQTLDTLGSAYAPPGSAAHGPARWLHLGAARVKLAPGQRAVVLVSVVVPRSAAAGDYLAGVSVEALGQSSQAPAHRGPPVQGNPRVGGGVAIASVDRYAIGVETSLPGARHPAIRFTGARVEREPAGLTFLLEARNTGNAILQGVHGWVQVTRGARTVLSRAIEAGTFVTDSSIAYPVPAFGQRPAEGTRYHLNAWLRYPGGIARLNTAVTFGHRQAVIQQRYGGPHAGASGTAWWKIALAVALILYALATTVMLLRRRRSGAARR
jgi:hypothetical protein